MLITCATRSAEAKRGRSGIRETMMVIDKRNAKRLRPLDIFSLLPPPSLSFRVLDLNVFYLHVPFKTSSSCEVTGQIFGSQQLKKCS